MWKNRSLNDTRYGLGLLISLVAGVSSAHAQSSEPPPPESTVVTEAVPITTSVDPVLISSVNTPVEAAVAVDAGQEVVNGMAVALHETDVLVAEADGTITSEEAQLFLQFMAVGGAVHAFREDVSGQGWIILSQASGQGDSTTDYLAVNSQSIIDWFQFVSDWLWDLQNGGSDDDW